MMAQSLQTNCPNVSPSSKLCVLASPNPNQHLDLFLHRDKRHKPMEADGEAMVGNQDPIFPQELITEILIRLPVKSLLQFKAVCKDWNSIISNPEFAKMHLNFSKLSPSYNLSETLFVHSVRDPAEMLKCRTINNGEGDEEEFWDRIPFPYCEDYKNGSLVMGSCNGLVCICFNRSICYGIESLSRTREFFYIWNPCTHQFFRAVLPGSPRRCGNVCNGGFGYVSSEDDYKILSFNFYSGVRSLRKMGFVYSLKANSWTEISVDPNFPIMTSQDHGVVFNEKLYWVHKKSMFSFDLKDSSLHEITQSTDFDLSFVCVVGGSLCACRRIKRNNEKLLEIYKFEQESTSECSNWMKMLKLDVSSLETRDVFVRGFFGFTNSCKIILQTNDGILVVDPNGDPSKFVSLKNGFKTFLWGVVSFHETLVSPYHHRKNDTNVTKDAGKATEELHCVCGTYNQTLLFVLN